MARFPACVLLVLLGATLWGQQPASSSSKAPSHTRSSLPDPGAIRDGVYRNSSFGFSYKLPFGWVDRTRDLQDDSADAPKALVLLAFFERPPEATGETVNSAVVIAAEPASAYPGLKAAAQYFGPLTELAKARGFQLVGEPYEFPVGTTQLARGDFTKPRGSLIMHQSSLVTLERGYVISFTLIGGSEDEVNQLIEKLDFAPRKTM